MFGEIMEDVVATPVDTVTLVAALIDESGSMTGVRAETIGGYNSFVSSIQKEQEGKTAYVSTFLFDSNGNKPFMRTLQDAVELKSATPLSVETYNPSGMTPLYDAVGKAIQTIDAAVKDKNITKITFLIQTDGAENSSREFSLKDVKSLIDERTKAGWQIIFLGADLNNAKDMGMTLGVSANNSMRYSKSSTLDTFSVMSASTQSYRSSGIRGVSADVELSDEDRAKIGDNS